MDDGKFEFGGLRERNQKFHQLAVGSIRFLSVASAISRSWIIYRSKILGFRFCFEVFCLKEGHIEHF